MSKPYWQGVFPAITTQFQRDQSLDLEATARHADALIASGVNGLIFLGSLGENQQLLPGETSCDRGHGSGRRMDACLF